MSVEDEVLSIRSQLEKITAGEKDAAQSLDLLRTLGELKVTLSVLTTTRIGMTVNAMRKASNDDEVIHMAKSLIKTWKKFVPESAEKKERKKEEKAEKEAAAAEKDKEKKDKDPALKSFPARPQVRVYAAESKPHCSCTYAFLYVPLFRLHLMKSASAAARC